MEKPSELISHHDGGLFWYPKKVWFAGMEFPAPIRIDKMLELVAYQGLYEVLKKQLNNK